ncbi:MAG: hypothetical protein M1816_007659 [Peltula sp. TS41687]|nr:MAG: hypothetical protein M1816_007659 [Peltula sp. TS41687]
MHSTLVRAQNVFGFFTTIIFVVSALIASSVLFIPQSPSASINLRNVQVVRGRAHYYSTQKSEYAHIKFDLDADLSSLFNWNTKQVFVYVSAKWASPSRSSNNTTMNEAVIWDVILPSSSFSSVTKPWARLGLGKQKGKKPHPKQKVKPKEKIGVLNLRNQKPKYQITDPSGTLAEKGDVTLAVAYNVQPWVGALVWGGSGNDGVVLDAGRKSSSSRRWWSRRWEGLKGGRSEVFSFPAIKGKKVDATAAAAKKA